MKNNTIREINFKLREYELARNLLYNGVDSGFGEKLWKEVEAILKDEDYQKESIRVVKDKFGTITLSGMVTPSLIIQNAEFINKKIVAELIESLLCSYIDKEKTTLLIHTKDIAGISYFKLILMNHEIELEKFAQALVTSEMLSLYKNKGYDNELITLYLINPSISIEYKQQLVNEMDEDDLLLLVETWKNDIIEGINDIHGIPADITLFDSFVNSDTEDMVDSILKIIDSRLNE